MQAPLDWAGSPAPRPPHNHHIVEDGTKRYVDMRTCCGLSIPEVDGDSNVQFIEELTDAESLSRCCPRCLETPKMQMLLLVKTDL